MKNKLMSLLLLLASTYTFAQVELTWKDLADITYTEKYYPDYGSNFLYPDFSKSIEELQGKEVSIVGYFLDIDPSGNLFILSKNPMASCFFCGASGPETAMEIQFKNKPNFKTDDIVVITGKLKLNKDDVEHFNYILTESTGLKMK